MQKTIYRIPMLVIVFVFILMNPHMTMHSGAEEFKRDKVRVGFFQLDGYHMIDSHGCYNGYGYEVIQKLARYNDWDIEYVGYNKSWSQMQEMLADGEIDILTSAQKTADRMENFMFSDKSIGESATMLTVKSGNSNFVQGDYSTYDGMRVGMLRNSPRNDSLKKFAKSKGFSYKAVYFEDSEHMEKVLQDGGTIDAIVTNNLRLVNNETVLDEFEAFPFYVMVKKGDTKLMRQINYAINQTDVNNPGWRYDLFSKYYQQDNGESISYSSDEKTYIEKVNKSNIVFKVVFNPDRKPYSYYDSDGKPAGIVIDIFEEIAKRTGIKYKYISVKDRAEYTSICNNNEADMVIDGRLDDYQAECRNYQMTDAYLSTSLARVNLKNYSDKIMNLATLQHADINIDTMNSICDGMKCTSYNNLNECLDAIISKENDAMYVYTYTAQQLASDDVRNRLTYTVLPDYSLDMGVAVSERFPHELLSIVNKGVKSVKGSYTDEVTVATVQQMNSEMSFIGYLYNKPEMLGVATAIVVGILFLVIMLYYKSKESERTLLQSQKLSRFMGYVCQVNDRVLEVNNATHKCMKYEIKDGEVVTEQDDKLIYSKLSERNMFDEDYKNLMDKLTPDSIIDLIDNQSKMYFECRVRDDDERYRWYSFTLQGIPKDKDHPCNFIVFQKDINAVKLEDEIQKHALQDALETARQASNAKGTFLSRMSHEIRTPLNAIIGYLTIAKMPDSTTDKILHCMENSELAAKHLLNIINDVLDMSSIESGRLKIANEDFDLKKQISTVSSIFYNQAKNKGVIFEVIINNLSEEWVVGDQLRLNQVLMNLLSNAVKFTGESGKVTLTIEQISMSDEDVHINFTVNDTGVGMSKEYMSRIFTPFEQESAKTAQQFGGTGLGLSITKNLVTMMGGSINVGSEENVGTTFKVALTFAKSKQSAEQNSEINDLSKIRALVVDDQKSECDYVKTLMKRCGVKCDTVLNGKDAVKQIKRRANSEYSYNICIMDWNMPDANGIQIAKMIHEECDKQIPIIIATAYDISEIEDIAIEAGVDKVIAKPLFQSTMFDLLVTMFGKYKPKNMGAVTEIDLSGMRIMLVEDNSMNMEIAEEVLRKSGLVVDTAVNGSEAVDLFNKSCKGYYQCILMDIQMPVMNGYEATKAIRRSSHEEAKSIPIIAMTANAFAEDVSMALASGMNDHIAKPIDYNKLFNVLSRFLKI